MKRLPHVKNLKRLSVLNRPVRVADIRNHIDQEAYTDPWLLEVEKIEAKRLRRFRHQLAS